MIDSAQIKSLIINSTVGGLMALRIEDATILDLIAEQGNVELAECFLNKLKTPAYGNFFLKKLFGKRTSLTWSQVDTRACLQTLFWATMFHGYVEMSKWLLEKQGIMVNITNI